MNKSKIGPDGRFLPDPKLNFSKKLISDLYTIKGYSQCKIAKKLGCSYTHIGRLLRKYEIPVRDKIIFKISKKELSDLYVNKQYSQSKIARIIGCTPSTIGDLLNKYKIQKRDNIYFFRYEEYTLSNLQKEIITGALLGDGHLTRYIKYGKVNSQFTYRSSIKEHVEYIASFFKNILTGETKNIKKYQTFDKRTNKWYTGYYIKTIRNITFTKLRDKWYPEGIKIIPKNLRLTPKVCLVWYAGDGHLKKGTAHSIQMATNGFTKRDIDTVLVPKLLNYKARSKKVYAKDQFTLEIPRRYSYDFLRYIGKCPIDKFSYKWNIPEYKLKAYLRGTVKNRNLERTFVDLYKKGLTCSEIAKIYNVDHGSVRHCLKKYKIYKFKDIA